MVTGKTLWMVAGASLFGSVAPVASNCLTFLVPVGSNQHLYLVREGDRLYAYEVPPTEPPAAAAQA